MSMITLIPPLPPVPPPVVTPTIKVYEKQYVTPTFFEAGRDFLRYLAAPNATKIEMLESKAAREMGLGHLQKASLLLQKSGNRLWYQRDWHRAEAQWVRSAQLALGVQDIHAIISCLLKQGILTTNINRGRIPNDDFLIAALVGCGSVASVKKIFGQNIVLKIADRTTRFVDYDKPGVFADALSASRYRFKKTVEQLQKMDRAGFRVAKIWMAGDEWAAQELISGIPFGALSKTASLDDAAVAAAKKSFDLYLADTKLAGFEIDRPGRNLIFELSSGQWVAVDV